MRAEPASHGFGITKAPGRLVQRAEASGLVILGRHDEVLTGATARGAAAAAVETRPGSSATQSVVKAAIAAITVRSVPKPAAFTVGPEQIDGERAHAERDGQPHARHPRAHPVVHVLHDHGVDEGNGAEDEDHEGQDRRVERPAAGAGGEQEQRRLHGRDRQVHPLERVAVDELADDELGERGHGVDRRQQHAQRGRIVDQPAQALGQQLAVAVGREVEDEAAGDGGQRHHQEDPRHHGPRDLDQLLRAPGRRHLLSRDHEPGRRRRRGAR